MTVSGRNQSLSLSFSMGNPVINTAISTRRWLRDEETLKLLYSSFEWHPRCPPLKVARRPQFLLGGPEMSPYDTYLCGRVHTHGILKYFSYPGLYSDNTEDRLWEKCALNSLPSPCLPCSVVPPSLFVRLSFIPLPASLLPSRSLETSLIPDSYKGLFHLILQTLIYD